MASICGLTLKNEEPVNETNTKWDLFLNNKKIGSCLKDDADNVGIDFSFNYDLLNPIVVKVRKSFSKNPMERDNYNIASLLSDLFDLTTIEKEYKEEKDRNPNSPLVLVVFKCNQEFFYLFNDEPQVCAKTNKEIIKEVFPALLSIYDVLPVVKSTNLSVFRCIDDFNVKL